MTKKKTIPQRLDEIEAVVNKTHMEVHAMSRTMAIANDAVKTSEPRPSPEPPFWGWFKSAHSEETFRRLLRVTGYGGGGFYFIDLKNSANDPLDCDEPTWRKDLLVCLATKYEIKSHLITEAKKRFGNCYKKITFDGYEVHFSSIIKFSYFADPDRLYAIHHNGGCCIYQKGKWAEKVKPEPIYVPYLIGINCGGLTFNRGYNRLDTGCKGWWVNMADYENQNTGHDYIITDEPKIEEGDMVFFGIDPNSIFSISDIYNYGFLLSNGKVVHIAGKTVEWDYEPKNQIRKVERV